jgi:hypothetical protein
LTCPRRGWISDLSSIQTAFVAPLVCYGYVLHFAVRASVRDPAVNVRRREIQRDLPEAQLPYVEASAVPLANPVREFNVGQGLPEPRDGIRPPGLKHSANDEIAVRGPAQVGEGVVPVSRNASG